MTQNFEESEYIFLTDDEGNEEKFEIIYKFEHEDNNYILMVPSDQEDLVEEAEVYAFRYEENDEGYTLHTIEDDAEWDMIEEVFNTLNEELN